MSKLKKYIGELLILILFIVIGYFVVSNAVDKHSQRTQAKSNTSIELIEIKTKLRVYNVRHLRDDQETWSLGNTDQWTVLNGHYAAQDCPPLIQVLQAHPHVLMLPPSAAMLVATNPDEQVLKLAVPKFKTRPVDMDSCSGLAYDESTGYLVHGKLKVAFTTK